MKLLKAIVRPNKVDEVKDALTRLDAICPAQDLVVPSQFVVVVNKTSQRGPPLQESEVPQAFRGFMTAAKQTSSA